jgi:hypothetical protein
VEYSPFGTKGFRSVTTISGDNLTAHLQEVVAEEVRNATGFSWIEYSAIERVVRGQVI